MLNLKERTEECWKLVESGIAPEEMPEAVLEIMNALNVGKIRIVEKLSGININISKSEYLVNEYIKKAILLYFKYSKVRLMHFGGTSCFDKVPLKFSEWTESDFERMGFRVAPGAIVRYSAYIAPKVVVMQSFVNVGAFVDEGSMLDTYSLVGSCAQVGKRCHISAGAILGGVLEPVQANPVIIEDDCFIGAGSSVTEGVIVKKGAVIASGVHLTASTKIIDRDSGEVSYGIVPEYAILIPGTYPSGGINLGCAVIVKRCCAETRKKTSINELLRGIV